MAYSNCVSYDQNLENHVKVSNLSSKFYFNIIILHAFGDDFGKLADRVVVTFVCVCVWKRGRRERCSQSCSYAIGWGQN